MFDETGVAAVMLARGALGNPWLFEQLLGTREQRPTRAEVLEELDWTIARAVEHLGEARATRYLRKFYPWYVRAWGSSPERASSAGALQQPETLAEARALLSRARRRLALAAERRSEVSAPLYCCAR